MNYSLFQEVLAAGKDGGDWMQILIFVAMAVIYGISTIVKSRANKAEDEKQQQQQRKGGTGSAKKVRPQVHPQRVKAIQPQPAPLAKRVEVKRERAIGEAKAEYVKAQELSQPKRRISPKLGKLPEFTSRAVETVEEIVSETAEEMPEVTSKTFRKLEKKYAAGKAKAKSKKAGLTLLDFSERRTLRQAILHYEILGKPLALRKPQEF